jgi:hypothetical protein
MKAAADSEIVKASTLLALLRKENRDGLQDPAALLIKATDSYRQGNYYLAWEYARLATASAGKIRGGIPVEYGPEIRSSPTPPPMDTDEGTEPAYKYWEEKNESGQDADAEDKVVPETTGADDDTGGRSDSDVDESDVPVELQGEDGTVGRDGSSTESAQETGKEWQKTQEKHFAEEMKKYETPRYPTLDYGTPKNELPEARAPSYGDSAVDERTGRTHCRNCKSRITPVPKLLGGYKCPMCGEDMDGW